MSELKKKTYWDRFHWIDRVMARLRGEMFGFFLNCYKEGLTDKWQISFQESNFNSHTYFYIIENSVKFYSGWTLVCNDERINLSDDISYDDIVKIKEIIKKIKRKGV
jgi:hypothetical protein